MTESLPEMEAFLAALELEGAEREDYIAAIEDVALRARVEKLLDAHESLGDRDPLAVVSEARRPDSSMLVGKEIDGFRIVGELGRGGMGVVYDALQITPRRQVALKTLPITGAMSRDGQQRLEREAATLARMSHPGVAQVFGSGRSDELDGRPYLVMERIDGVPIDVYCRDEHLDVGARLELLARVGDAVGHAHARGIVHRDLKPANVLVQRDGMPKVLDFGIAYVLDAELRNSLRTRTGQVLGTLAYMAPEQITGTEQKGRGNTATARDPRVDVYALGALGYEMLAGRLPIEPPEAPLADAIRRIAELEPQPLGVVAPTLRGDIEVVIGKAIDRDPGRRYAHADEFARDLRRILADEPVHARAPSTAYQVRKFVRRNRGLCVAAAAIVVSLTGGLVWALIERSAAQRARSDAVAAAAIDRQRARSMTRMVSMLGGLVQSSTPHKKAGAPPTIDAIVDELAGSLDAEYADEPFVLGRTHLVLVDVMIKRGQGETAAEHLEKARAALDSTELDGPLERALVHAAAAKVGRFESRRDDSIAELERGLVLARESGDSGVLVDILSSLANQLADLRRDLPRAEELALELVDLSRAYSNSGLQVLGRVLDASDRGADALEVWDSVIERARLAHPGSLHLASALQNLGLLRHRLGDLDGAVAPLEEALSIRREAFRDQVHAELGYALDNLASVQRDRGLREEALGLFDEAEQVFRAFYRGPHLDLAVCLTERGVAKRDLGRTEPARADLEAALTVYEELGGSPTTQHAAALEHLVMLPARDGDHAARIAMAERALALRERVHGAGHFLVARGCEVVAAAKFDAGDNDGAEAAARRCVDLRLEHYGENDWRTWSTGWFLWIPLARRGELEAAVELIERAIAGTTKSLGGNATQRVTSYLENLLEIRKAMGDAAGVREVEERIGELRRLK